jgi:hypothetical protein
MKYSYPTVINQPFKWIKKTSSNSSLVLSDIKRREHTKGFRIGLFLFVVGLNVYFALPFLFPTDIYSSVLKTWRYYVVAYLFIMIGAGLEFRRAHLSLQPAFKTWVAIIVGSLAFMAARSLIVGEALLYIFWNLAIYLSLILMALLGQSGTIWKTLNRIFIIHTLVGSIYVLQKLLVGDIIRREDLMRMEGFNIISSGGWVIPAALYAVPFLIFTFPIQHKLGKLTAAIGYIATALIIIFWQGRLGSILLVVQFLILLLLLWRGMRLRILILSRVIRPIIVTGSIILILFSLANLGESLGFRFSQGISLLIDRWYMGGSLLRTTEEDSRIYEARVFIQQLSWDEWIAGRGLAATWQDPRVFNGEVRNMVHVGYLHYILIGGLMLLILMLFPFAWGLRALLNSKDFIKMAAGALWVQYSIMLLGYGFPTASMTWVVMGLALGKCIAMDGIASPRRTLGPIKL